MLVAARVLFGERRLVVPARDRVTDLTLAKHRLELALVLVGNPSPEQLAGPLGAADQYAQLAGALEERLERRGSLEDDVGGQLHLGHAVAVARRQRRTLGRAEDGDQPAQPVRAA